MLDKVKDKRRSGRQRIRWLDSITDAMDSESEQIPGGGEGQGSLGCCSPWGHKELDVTEQLNNIIISYLLHFSLLKSMLLLYLGMSLSLIFLMRNVHFPHEHTH